MNELLAGRAVPANAKDGYVRPGYKSWIEVGDTKATYASFRALRSRLVAVGFVIKGSVTEGFTMTFPEEAA